ncbi:MAG TPA: condensation domain-containing protein, partial [Pyrinomonadaceae bacterium]|nr:condensation domain-containing protein [Pyrinomonadaceae bacterium]
MKLHPPLVDVACGFLSLTMKERYLPVAFEAVKVKGRLPERIYSHITFSEDGATAPEVLSCDVRLLDEEGLELVVIEGFTAKRVNDAAALQSSLRRARAPDASVAREGVGVALDSYVAARRGVRRGIFNEEGVDAFERVLGRGLRPQVVVSPVNFGALIEEARALTSERVLGEMEKQQLVRQSHPRPDLQTPYVAPGTAAESTLAGIWQQLLGLERVGVHDNFFDLGGHSLLATQLVSRAREAFRVELPLRSVFDSPTVAGMAQTIVRAQTSEPSAEAPPVRPAPRDGELPLSFAQQRLWFLEQLEPGASVHNFFGAFRLAGPLDVATLEAGLNEVIRRHEVLRTNFLSVDGEPVLFIHRERAQSLSVVDLRGLPAAEREPEARRLAGEEVRLPFDLQRDPLLRVLLLRLADEEHVLVLVMHHIISDGWSTGVFARELTTLYAAFDAGRPSPLPELQIQYIDYAVWQREWLRGPVLSEQIEYWRGRMAGAPPVLELPFDRPRPPMQSFRGASERFTLPAELSRSLQALCREEDVTPFMLLLAAFQVLLMRYSGQEDVVVGTPIAGRTRAETEELIGLFVNTLVLRTDLSGNPTFREVLGRVRETALGAYAHQDLPFELLVEVLQPVRSLSHSPIFQVAFILQNAMGEVLELPNLSMRSFEIDSSVSRVDLTLELYERADGIGGWFEYNTDLFEQATIALLIRHFQTLLEAVAAGVSQRVAHLPLLAADERLRIISEAGPPRTPIPPVPAHQLFEAQAAHTPDDIAVSFEDAHLTYAQLNERADALAARLRRAGVRAEARVGLFVERSLDMVVALLGVLKSGGAYVPLDIDMPAPRLTQMVEDAGIRLFVTQRPLSERLESSGAATPKLYVDEPGEAGEADGASGRPAEHGWPEEWMGRLAYVIYTSGSTGTPKGVAVPHGALANLLLSMTRRPGLAPPRP